MSSRCYLCGNTRQKSNNIILHSFPKDETLRNKWISACGLSSSDNLRNVKICCIHFSPRDYKQSRRIGMAATYLNKDAVPSVVLQRQRQSSQNAQLQVKTFSPSKPDNFRLRYATEVTPSNVASPIYMELMNKNSQACLAMGSHREETSKSTYVVDRDVIIITGDEHETKEDDLSIKEEELNEDAEFLTDDELEYEESKTLDDDVELKVTQSLRSTTPFHTQPTHVVIQTHVCALCNARFLSSSDLHRHEQTHLLTTRPCGDTFAENSAEMTHTCALCYKEYATAAKLNEHIGLHLTEWRHKCVPCDRIFGNSAEINAHNLQFHAGKDVKESKPVCWMCKTTFSSPASLQAHVAKNKKIKSNNKCVICNRTFSIRCHLSNHLRPDGLKAPFRCKDCTQIFAYPCAREIHRCKQDALYIYQPETYQSVPKTQSAELLALAGNRPVARDLPQAETYQNVVKTADADSEFVALDVPQPKTYQLLVNMQHDELLKSAPSKPDALELPQLEMYQNVVNVEDDELLAFAGNRPASLELPQPETYQNVVKTGDAVGEFVALGVPQPKTYQFLVNMQGDKLLESADRKPVQLEMPEPEMYQNAVNVEDHELLAFASNRPAALELPQPDTYAIVNLEGDELLAFVDSKPVAFDLLQSKIYQSVADVKGNKLSALAVNMDDDELLAFAGNEPDTQYKKSKSIVNATNDKNQYITSFQKFLEEGGSIKNRLNQ